MYETHLFLKLLITYELWNTCSFKQNDNKLYVASTKKALQMYRFDNSPWLPSSSWRYIKICMWYSSMCLKKAVLWKNKLQIKCRYKAENTQKIFKHIVVWSKCILCYTSKIYFKQSYTSTVGPTTVCHLVAYWSIIHLLVGSRCTIP